MESSHGQTRKILRREIANIFGEIDRSKGLQTLIFRNIEGGQTMIAKQGELIFALQTSSQDVDKIDEILLSLGSVMDKMKEQDALIRELDRTSYRSEPIGIDAAARLAALHEEIASVPQETRSKVKKTTPERVANVPDEEDSSVSISDETDEKPISKGLRRTVFQKHFRIERRLIWASD